MMRAYLRLDDDALLAQCEAHIYKASGPGGQHRNKVSSAVRLHHGPSGVSAHGDDSRSQHENKRLALRRLRMNIALRIRRPFDRAAELPESLAEHLHRAKNRPDGPKRLTIGRRDRRFWTVAAIALDALAACDGQVKVVAQLLGATTSHLVRFFKSERHLLGAAQQIRKEHDLHPIR